MEQDTHNSLHRTRRDIRLSLLPTQSGRPCTSAPPIFAAPVNSVLAVEKTALFPDILIYDTIDREEEKGNEKNFRGQGIAGVSPGIGI